MTPEQEQYLKYGLPLFLLLLIGGSGAYVYYSDHHQVRQSIVDIWYVEEIDNPYGEGDVTVIQVTYVDYLGNHVLLFKKSTISMTLTAGQHVLDYETDDSLFKKTKPWILTGASKIS